jgi:hypothetical protein
MNLSKTYNLKNIIYKKYAIQSGPFWDQVKSSSKRSWYNATHAYASPKKSFFIILQNLKMEYTSLIEGVSVMDSVPNHNNTTNPWTLMDIVAYKEILNPNLTSF